MTAQWKRIVRTKVKLGIRWDNGQAQPTGAWIDITLSEGSPPVNWQTYLKQKLTERGVECRDASGHVMVSAKTTVPSKPLSQMSTGRLTTQTTSMKQLT
jgi:hypothetical protein